LWLCLREVVVAVAAKTKKSKTSASHWGFRLAGVVLCVFFVLGVITGLSRPGRTFALRVQALLNFWPGPGHSSIIPVAFLGGAPTEPALDRRAANSSISSARRQGSEIALVQRSDGFYALDSDGRLSGPVAPATQGDMPILSGAAALAAIPAQLINYAEALVRAEAGLGAVISEMRIDTDRTATIFLEHPRIQVAFDLDRTALELSRALAVLRMWRGHEDLIAALDLTTPGQAVMQMKPAAFAADHRAPAVQTVALAVRARLPRNRREESAHR
jgi:cell division protein FtsQ